MHPIPPPSSAVKVLSTSTVFRPGTSLSNPAAVAQPGIVDRGFQNLNIAAALKCRARSGSIAGFSDHGHRLELCHCAHHTGIIHPDAARNAAAAQLGRPAITGAGAGSASVFRSISLSTRSVRQTRPMRPRSNGSIQTWPSGDTSGSCASAGSNSSQAFSRAVSIGLIRSAARILPISPPRGSATSAPFGRQLPTCTRSGRRLIVTAAPTLSGTPSAPVQTRSRLDTAAFRRPAAPCGGRLRGTGGQGRPAPPGRAWATRTAGRSRRH